MLSKSFLFTILNDIFEISRISIVAEKSENTEFFLKTTLEILTAKYGKCDFKI